jgi:hypothetical protein
MAGRNISVTHQALGTIRVMRTCGMMEDRRQSRLTWPFYTAQAPAVFTRNIFPNSSVSQNNPAPHAAIR